MSSPIKMSNHLARKCFLLPNLNRFSVPVAQMCNNLNAKELIVINDIVKPNEPAVPGVIKKTVTVPAETNIQSISGIPEVHIKERLVRIYATSKNASQSGTANVGIWEMEFDTRSRWENPLMGWGSTGDPLSNTKVQFNDVESAVKFAEKNGWKWFIEEEKPIKARGKSYAYNFSWNKRTRVPTK